MKHASLWLPFAALGLAAGLFPAGSLFPPGSLISSSGLSGLSDMTRFGALLFTPLSYALLGCLLQNLMGRWRLQLGRHGWLALVLGSTILAGGINGMLLGLLEGLTWRLVDWGVALLGAGIGLLIGAFSALSFLPATLVVSFAWRRVQAPAATPVGRAQRRGVWTTTVFFLVAAAATKVACNRSLGGPLAFLAMGATVIGALLLARDVGDLFRLRRLAARVRSMTPRLRPLGSVLELGAQRIELGAGDALFDELEAGAPFRGVDRVRCTVHGDPGLAIRAVRWAVARDAALLGVEIAALLSAALLAPHHPGPSSHLGLP